MNLSEVEEKLLNHLDKLSDEQFMKELKEAGLCLTCTCHNCGFRVGNFENCYCGKDCGQSNIDMCS